MAKKFSWNMSMEGWDIWKFLKGRKKLIITVIGLVGTQFAFDPELIALLAGGAVFEGVWSLAEFYFKKVDLE